MGLNEYKMSTLSKGEILKVQIYLYLQISLI